MLEFQVDFSHLPSFLSDVTVFGSLRGLVHVVDWQVDLNVEDRVRVAAPVGGSGCRLYEAVLNLR